MKRQQKYNVVSDGRGLGRGIKHVITTLTKVEFGLQIRQWYCITIKFPDFVNCSVIMHECALVLIKHTLKYLGIKAHYIYNLIWNCSGQ